MPISKFNLEESADDFFIRKGQYDYEDTYEEDFDRSTDSEKGKSAKSSKEKSLRQVYGGLNSSGGRDGSVYSEPVESTRKGYGFASKTFQSIGSHKRKKDRRKAPQGYSPRQAQNSSIIQQRVLSAKRNKFNTLQNLVLELQNEVDRLRIENRDLKRSTRLQEKAIKRLDDEEADLPLLLQKHSSEVRALKGKLKREKEGWQRTQEEVKKKDLEIMKLRDRVKKYEEIVRDKRLDERDKLQHKLEKLESELGEKEGKIIELEKVVRLSEKVRMRELKERNEKYKKATDELRRLENLQRNLQERFKEKEKELQTQNIYSQRIALKRKAMKSQLPALDFNIEDIPSTSRSDNTQTLKDEIITTNNSAAETERKTADVNESSMENKDVNIETMVSALRKKEEELEKMLEEERRKKQFEEDKRMLQEMEDKIKQKQEEIKLADKNREESRKQKEAAKKEEEERKMREMEYRAKQREEELRMIQQLEEEKAAERRRTEEESHFGRSLENKRTVENERVVEIDFTAKLAEQKIRREVLDEQLKTEKNILIIDEEAKRKKELLLARLNAIDNGKVVEDTNKVSQRAPYSATISFDIEPVPVATKAEKKKPIFLENTPVDDGKDAVVKHKPFDFSTKRRGSKPDYNFKPSDENLHRGLPSHADTIGNGKKNRQSAEFGIGESSPTAGSGGTKRVSRFKKPSENPAEKDEDFLFFDTKKKNQPVENSRRAVKKEKEDFLFFDTKKAPAPIPVTTAVDKDKPFTISSDNEKKQNSDKKQTLIRNRTRSISDDDSQLFTIGGKGPDKLKSGRISNDSTKSRKSTVGSGKRVFGAYEPTFGNTGSVNSNDIVSPDSDPFADEGPRFGRRQGQGKSGTPDGVSIPQNKDNGKQNGLINNLFDNTRNKAEKVTRAVDSFIDDDIEEMVLT